MYDFIKDNIMDINRYIKQHKHIQYCEAIIFKDGTICDVKPSHLYTLIRITKIGYDNIYEDIPVISAPINWLVEYTECAAVWYETVLAPCQMSKEQMKSIDVLQRNRIISGNLTIHRSGLNSVEMESIEKAREKYGYSKQQNQM